MGRRLIKKRAEDPPRPFPASPHHARNTAVPFIPLLDPQQMRITSKCKFLHLLKCKSNLKAPTPVALQYKEYNPTKAVDGQGASKDIKTPQDMPEPLSVESLECHPMAHQKS